MASGTLIDPRTIADDETYYVVNESRHHVAFAIGGIHDMDGYLVWKGPNDPDSSGDVRLAVPGNVLKRRQFQVALAKGILRLETAEDYYGSIEAEASSDWEDDTETFDAIDRSSQEGFEFLTCEGPAAKGSGERVCGDQVVMRTSQLAEKPPLCERHERYAKFFTHDDNGWSRLK